MAYVFKPDAEGSYLPGIPARSLSDDEFKALDPQQQAAVKASRLYEVEGEPEAPVVVSGAPEPAVDAPIPIASIAADVPAAPDQAPHEG